MSDKGKPKYIDECYENIKKILEKIESKNLISLSKYFIRILSDKNNLVFIGNFFLKENISDRKILNYYFNLTYKLIKSEENNFNLKLFLLGLKQIIIFIEPILKNDILNAKLKKIINKKIIKNYINISVFKNNDPNFQSHWIRRAIIFGQKNDINKKYLDGLKMELGKVKENIKYYEIISSDEGIKKQLDEEYEETINVTKDYDFNQKIYFMISKVYNSLQTEDKFLQGIKNNKSVRGLFPNQNIDINGNIKSIDNGDVGEIQTRFSLNCNIANYCYIYPILENIKQNYIFNERCFSELVRNNSFISEWHEVFFEKGLYYFLDKKPLEAFHILIPQIESSLRYIVGKHSPTTIQNNGKEKEKIDIEELIDKCKTNKLIDEKICFYFNILFSEKYYNIRNSLAHGFDTEYTYLTPVYSVFVCLLLYVLYRK